LLLAAVLATAVIPVLGKYQAPDDPTTNSPIAQVVWGMFYVAATVRLIGLRDLLRPLLSGSIGLVAFTLLMLGSFVWSVAPTTTLLNSVELIGTTIISFYIVARFTLAEFLWIIAIAFATIALLCFALIFLAPGHGRMFFGSGPWCGIYQDKNNLGAAMSLAVLSLLPQLTRCRAARRVVVVASLIMCLTLLVGAESATAFGDCVGAGMISFAILGCLTKRFGIVARVATAGAVLAILAAVFVFGVSSDDLLGAIGRSSTLTGRTDFWPYLQRAIADRPVFGYGYNAFFRSAVGDGYLSYYVVEAGGWTPYHAHNSLLQISLDAGYVGLSLLIYIIVVAMWKSIAFLARSATALSAWPLAVIVYLVLGSFTETYFGNYNTIEWIFFAAALLYPLKERAWRKS
jgi:O-antigen ligase